jgi:Fe-S-cluster containining protein
MFRCYDCGACCEDVCTQINLTLGDIKRLSEFTGKSALQLYKKGIIGIFPFGDPVKNGEYETEMGIYVPCLFRKKQPNGRTRCSIYPARPLNCRLFPYWILTDAPETELKKMGKYHECMRKIEFDDEFKEDKKTYFLFKEAILKIFLEESKVTEEFYSKTKIKAKIKAKKTSSREGDIKVIKQLVSKLAKKDYSKFFRLVDREIVKHGFTSYEAIPIIESFYD